MNRFVHGCMRLIYEDEAAMHREIERMAEKDDGPIGRVIRMAVRLGEVSDEKQ